MKAKTESSDMCRYGTERRKADSKNTRKATVSK
jgi:hypothetical protein